MRLRDHLLLYTSLLYFHITHGRYSRYFYNPFTDWDKEFYDASMDSLKLAAPPPPPVPDVPSIRTDFSFDLSQIPFPQTDIPRIPLPSVSSSDLFPGFSTAHLIPNQDLPADLFSRNPGFGGYGAFNKNYKPLPQQNFDGNYGPVAGYGSNLRGPEWDLNRKFSNFGTNMVPPLGTFTVGVPNTPPRQGIFGNLGHSDFYGGSTIYPNIGRYQNMPDGGNLGGFQNLMNPGAFGTAENRGSFQNFQPSGSWGNHADPQHSASSGTFGVQAGFGTHGNFAENNALPSIGGYSGFTGYANRQPAISGYGPEGISQIPVYGFGGGNFPGDSSRLPPNLMSQPTSFSAVPYERPVPLLPAVSFSNYDNNGLLPQIQPETDLDVTINLPANVLRSPSSFDTEQAPVVRKHQPAVQKFSAVVKTERLCKPLGKLGLTGFCRNSFDIINNRACKNMAVDSQTSDCGKDWCCYWRPKTSLKSLPSRLLNIILGRDRTKPGCEFATSLNPSKSMDNYYHIASHVIVPEEQARTPQKSDDGFQKNRSRPSSTLPEAPAAERSIDLTSRLVPRIRGPENEALWGTRSCGNMRLTAESGRSSRIISGDIAAKGELCWQVAIYLGNEYICGGALVDDNHVVTSAHCLQRFQKDNTIANMKVAVGTTDITNVVTDSCTKIISVDSVRLHDAFNTRTLANDIAVIRLSHSVPANNCTCTICLPDPDTGPLRIDSSCLVTGYGLATASDPLNSGKLRSAQVQVINSTSGPVNCQMIMDAFSGMPVEYKLDPSMFCTISRDVTYANGVGMGDTCMRDGGSPLICALSARDSSRWTLAGVVSWGLGCGRTTESIRMPSVYTNVRKQVPWIMRNIN